MNYKKVIEETSEQIKNLEKAKKQFKEVLQKLEGRDGIGLFFQTTGFMYKNLVDLPTGFLMENIGYNLLNEKPSIERTQQVIKDVENELKKANEKLSELETEQKNTEKMAEIIVEKDIAYVKGDKNKNNIFAEVQEYRKRAKESIEKILKDKNFKETLEIRSKLYEILKGCGLKDGWGKNAEIVKDSNSSLNYDKPKNESRDTFVRIGEYLLPTYDFSEDLKAYYVKNVQYYDNKVKVLYEEKQNFKPSGIGKVIPIFAKKQRRAFEEENESSIKYYNDYKNEFLSKFEAVDVVKKEVINPLFENAENKKVVEAYLKLPTNKTIEDIIETYKEAKNKLENNCCLPRRIGESNIQDFIPKEVKEFCDENNIKLTDEMILEAAKKLKNGKEIEAELKNINEVIKRQEKINRYSVRDEEKTMFEELKNENKQQELEM